MSRTKDQAQANPLLLWLGGLLGARGEDQRPPQAPRPAPPPPAKLTPASG